MEPDFTALWREVVAQAVRDVLSPKQEGASSNERDEAYHWIMGDNTETYTYLWACDVAGVDPEIGRKILRERDIG